MTSTLKTIADAKKQEALKKAIANGGKADIRVVYSTDTDEAKAAAAAAWEKAKALADAEGIAVISMPEEITNADGTTINPFDGNRIAIAGLMQRVESADKKKQNVIAALVRFPMPTVATFMDEKPDWIDKLVEKEASHVAFRRLRDAESVDELTAGMSQVPFTAEGYAADYRGGDGLDTDAFDTMWSPFRQKLIADYPALENALPSKAEVLRCIRSAAYAQETQPDLEKTKLFRYIAMSMIDAGPQWVDLKTEEASPQEVQPLIDMLAERDTFKYPTRTIDSEAIGKLSFDIGV